MDEPDDADSDGGGEEAGGELVMCPVCIANMAWLAAGATSTGGVTALVMSSLRGKKQQLTVDAETEEYSESETITSKENRTEGEEDGEQ